MEGPAAPSSPPTDFVTFGHYRVARRPDGKLDMLGKGAMGVTYRAWDPELRLHVALKVIKATNNADDDTRRRFRREARAAAQLLHPNIARVILLGEQGIEFYYVMDYVAGRSLAALLKEEKTLPLGVALALAAQVAAALAAAHKRELVHRDLKPANLMLLEGDALDHEDERTTAAGRRQVKVIDFGLARRFGQSRLEDSEASSTGGFTGTPGYASAEQCSASSGIDGRSDLYSLGVILWRCLAGSLPFVGTPEQVLGMHQFQQPPLEKIAGQPIAVIELLAGLLEKDPADRRPQTAGELRDRLDELRRALPSTADLLPPPPAPLPTVEDSATTQTTLGKVDTIRTSPPIQPVLPAAERPRWLVWLGATVGVLLIAFALPMLRSNSSLPKSFPTDVPASAPAPAPRPTATPLPTPSPRTLAAEAAKRNFTLALAQAETFEEADGSRSSALASIAVAQAKSGDVAGATTTANKIWDGFALAAVHRIAVEQAKAGDILGAKTTAERLLRASDKAPALAEIAVVRAKAGDRAGAKSDFDEAIALAENAEEPSSGAYQLFEIAILQAKAGDIGGARLSFERAKARAATIADASDRPRVLAKIAAAQAKTGDMVGAKLAFDQAKVMAVAFETSKKEFIFQTIAEDQASAGDIGGAIATASLIADAFYLGYALREIAAAQAKAGDVVGAKATVTMIAAVDARAKVNRRAKADSSAKPDAGPSALFPSMILSPDRQSDALGEIAMAQAKAGDVDGAKATAARIESNYYKDKALCGVAVALAKAGDIAGAKETLTTVGNNDEKLNALRAIAAAQVGKDGISLAEAWVKAITNLKQRCYAHLGVAEAAGAMAQGRTQPGAAGKDEDDS